MIIEGRVTYNPQRRGDRIRLFHRVVGHVVDRAVPIFQLLLGDLPEYPPIDVVSHDVVVQLELTLLDETFLDVCLNGNHLGTIVL